MEKDLSGEVGDGHVDGEHETSPGFEEVADHHLGASSPQFCRSSILATHHGANRKPATLEDVVEHYDQQFSAGDTPAASFPRSCACRCNARCD